MGKKGKVNTNLGRSLIKDRFGTRKPTADSFLHTSELNDGFDWNRINFASVTEESSLEEFLATAELAGTEFTAEKMNVAIVNSDHYTGLLSAEEAERVAVAQEVNKDLLNIPRRPEWNEKTTPEELDQKEKESFLEWRRNLALLQEKEHIMLTPFEKNLEFWRQLWRVIERSDVLIQIVDARNPLLYRNTDLEKYVKQVNNDKVNMILINKADYLTEQQRKCWAKYFDKVGMKVAFWSATMETERIKNLEKEEEGEEGDEEDEEDEDYETEEEESETEDRLSNSDNRQETEGGNKNDKNNRSTTENAANQYEKQSPTVTSSDTKLSVNTGSTSSQTLSQGGATSNTEEGSTSTSRQSPADSKDSEQENSKSNKAVNDCVSSETAISLDPCKNSSELLDGEALVALFKSFYTGKRVHEDYTTIGFVGYPNVGKSSTINALIHVKKVSVSATPGHTKHFQTLFLDEDLLLCDCPGLVMPSFVSTKADLVISGILSIDQQRDIIPPISLVCRDIPRHVLESTYGIMLPKPKEGEDPDRVPTAYEFLGTYGCMRGYMTHKGIPDMPRSARCILKDYVSGKLLYCHPPPDVSTEEFVSAREPLKPLKLKQEPLLMKLPKGAKPKMRNTQGGKFDSEFFRKPEPRIGSKGVKGVVNYSRKEGTTEHHKAGDASSSTSSLNDKPWKRHGNRGKKEKLRRTNASLDVY